MEESLKQNLDTELLEVGQLIERRRNILEQENKIFDERATISDIVASQIKDDSTALSDDNQINNHNSYINDLDPEKMQSVQSKIDTIFDKGLKKGITEAKNDLSALELDAFHDILVGRLYDELKKRGLI
ncbi:MAG TPA: hypothetical protein VI752_02610 [Candidatus Paceibacterota bacterium]